MKMLADPVTKIVTVPVATTATVVLAIATPRGTTDDTRAGTRPIAESRLAGIFFRKIQISIWNVFVRLYKFSLKFLFFLYFLH